MVFAFRRWNWTSLHSFNNSISVCSTHTWNWRSKNAEISFGLPNALLKSIVLKSTTIFPSSKTPRVEHCHQTIAYRISNSAEHSQLDKRQTVSNEWSADRPNYVQYSVSFFSLIVLWDFLQTIFEEYTAVIPCSQNDIPLL